MYSYIVHKYIYVYILMFVCMYFLEGLVVKKKEKYHEIRKTENKVFLSCFF